MVNGQWSMVKGQRSNKKILTVILFCILCNSSLKAQIIKEPKEEPLKSLSLEQYLHQQDSFAASIMLRYPNLKYVREIEVLQGDTTGGIKPDDASPYTLISETFENINGKRTGEGTTSMEELLGPTNETPAVFIIRGGGYAILNNQMANNNPNINIDVVAYLNNLNNGNDYKAFLVSYLTAESTPIVNWSSTMGELFEIQPPTTPSESYCTFQKHSIRAFYNLRKFVSDRVTNTTYKFNRDKMIFIGHSAGAQLALNYLFWDQNEIPTNLTGMFGPCFPSGFSGGPAVPSIWRTDYWLPAHKPFGIMAMSGFTSWPDILTNNDYTNIFANGADQGVPIYLLHGTKDRLVNQDTGRAPFRVTTGADEYIHNTTHNAYNEYYPKMFGSKWIYQELFYKPARLRYDQVCFGCHDIMQYNPNDVNQLEWGTWNWSNISGNIVLEKIMEFLTQVTTNTFPTAYNASDPLFPVKGLGSFYPDKLNIQQNLSAFDSTFISPITDVDIVCEDGVRKAKVTGGGQVGLFYYWRFNSCSTCNNGVWHRTLGNEWVVPTAFVGGTNMTIQVQAVNGCFTGLPYRFTKYLPTTTACIGSRMAVLAPSDEVENIFYMVNEGHSKPYLVVLAPEEFEANMQLIDMQGRIIAQTNQSFQEGYQEIQFVGHTVLPKGLYILQIEGEKHHFTNKFIIP